MSKEKERCYRPDEDPDSLTDLETVRRTIERTDYNTNELFCAVGLDDTFRVVDFPSKEIEKMYLRRRLEDCLDKNKKGCHKEEENRTWEEVLEDVVPFEGKGIYHLYDDFGMYQRENRNMPDETEGDRHPTFEMIRTSTIYNDVMLKAETLAMYSIIKGIYLTEEDLEDLEVDDVLRYPPEDGTGPMEIETTVMGPMELIPAGPAQYNL